MNHQLSGRLVAAARALTAISHDDLARASGVKLEALKRLEAGGAALLPDRKSEMLRRALEGFGAVVIPEGDGLGAGVRLKFTRLDVKQIGRLEGEGGPARPDDVP